MVFLQILRLLPLIKYPCPTTENFVVVQGDCVILNAMVKHFLKALGLFVIIIVLGMALVILTNHFEQNGTQATNTSTSVQVAK